MYSVVIPLYNKGPHIRRAAESALRQEGADFELVIVDDGSIDGGLETAETLAAADARIRVVRRSPPGPGGYAARNAGIREAAGDWIAFLDADDEWNPGFLAEMDRMRRKYPQARFMSSAYRIVESDGRTRLCRYASAGGRKAEEILSPEHFVGRAAENRWPTHTSSVVAEKAALLEAGGFPEGRCLRGGDRDTWLRLALSVPYAWTPFIGASYRKDSVNMVTRNTAHAAEHCLLGTIAAYLSRPPENGKERRMRRGLMRLHNRSLSNYFKQRWKRRELTFADLRNLYAAADPAAVLRWSALIVLGRIRR